MYRPLAIDKHCQVPIFPAVTPRLAAIDKAPHAPKRCLAAAWVLLVLPPGADINTRQSHDT